MSKGKNSSQYEKLLAGTPQSARHAEVGEPEEGEESGRGVDGETVGLGLRSGQLSLSGPQRRGLAGIMGPRELYTGSDSTALHESQIKAEAKNFSGSQRGQLHQAKMSKAYGHQPKLSQPGAATSSALGTQSSGQIPGYRPEMQSAAATMSRRKQGADSQLQGESGATSSTHPKISSAPGKHDARREELDGAQSSSGTPKSKLGAGGRGAQNLFAMSGQKSDEDEGDLDQFQSTRALRNRKLLGSDEIENDIESKGEGSSPSKQLKKNSFNLKEHSKFDMFHRNGRSIQELNVLKGADGEVQDITARSFEGQVPSAFEKGGLSETTGPGQGRTYKNLSSKDDLKHRSMLLTPKSLGAFGGFQEVGDQRHQSMNATPSGSGPTQKQIHAQMPEKLGKAGAGSEWTAGYARELVIEYENTEQKEHKAKGERMREIIERQMNAEYQNSVNKIMDGAQMNQRGVGPQKSGVAQRGKRTTRQAPAAPLNKQPGGALEEVHVRGFDDDGILLRHQHQSFHLPPRENDVGSFVNSGAISMKNQASSLAGGSQQPGEPEDFNGFYANDRAEDASVLVVGSGARGKHPASRRSQYSNASVLGRDASLTNPEGRPARLDSGTRADQQAGRPPVAAGSRPREQARTSKQLGQDPRGYAEYRLDSAVKSSNTSLAYSQQDQEEEIILDQADVDKQDAAFALLRGQRAPAGRSLMYGAGYKALEEAKQGQEARSAVQLAAEHGKSKGLPSSQLVAGRRESRQSSARRSEPRGAQAPDSHKKSQLAQKKMAAGIGSLDGSDFSLGRENARHDADFGSFSGLETVQLGNQGPVRGPQAKVQSFPVKSRHMFAKSQARVEEEAEESGGSKGLDREPSDADDGGERAPLSMNSKQNSANQASAEKATRAPGTELISRDNVTRMPKPTSISEFLSLSDNRKKNDERRGRPKGYDRIDDDEEQAALADQESPRSVLEVDQIVGHLADSTGDKSAATAQQLPASQNRRPQHAEGSQSPHVANSRGLEALQGRWCRAGDEGTNDAVLFAGYTGLGFQISNDASAAEPHLLSRPAAGLGQEEASHASASSAKAPALQHTAGNVLQRNLSQSNGPHNSSYYKSDDLISSKQLDEQIVSCEQHLESLRQLKREMMIQAKADHAQSKLYLHARTQSIHRMGRLRDGTPEEQAQEEEAARVMQVSQNSIQRAVGDAAFQKQRTLKVGGSGGARIDDIMGDASMQTDMKMPKVSKRNVQKLPSDDADVVSPSLDSPRPAPHLDQQFSQGDQHDMRLQSRQILVEEVPRGSLGAGAADSSRVAGLTEGSQVNRPLPASQMAPSFAQKRIESLSRHQKPTSPPPSIQIGLGLGVSPRELPAGGPFEAGRPEHQGSFLPTGRASHERGQGIRQSSKHEAIKLEKREKLFKEQLIRYFNQKLVDKVVSALKAKAAEELGYVEEEHEAAEDDSNQPLSDKADPQQAQRARDAIALGHFLFEAKGLDKQLAGQYFGEDKKFNQAVCREFLRCFNFRNLSIDSCWRLIFNKMGLPKEGQQIVRIMSIFQDVYLEKNPDRLKWPKDTVWLVSVKLMDLNTNLHNPNVKSMLRYSRETFVQQSMLIPELKAAFSAEKIADMYDRIAKQEFQSNVNLHEKYFKRINELSYTLVQQSMKSGLKQSGKGASGWQGQRRTINLKRSTLHDATRERNTQLLKTEGTIFTKYGRYGAPKQRLVYLNEDETAICWRDRINKQEKPRKLLIKDVRSVLIGADHTEVMRKQKIPAQFDYQYISILATNRSLDLSIDDKATIHLWCEKISRLLEARQARAQKCLHEASPEVVSPYLGQQPEAEVQIHTKDACPESLVYLWKCELLNNLQNYWNPLSKEIYVDQEIKFDEPGLKSAIVALMEQQGGPFLVFTEQDRRSQSPSYFRNFTSNQQSRAAGGPGPVGNDRPVPKNAGAGSITCGLGEKFSKWASASKSEPQPVAPQPSGPKVNKFFKIFGRRESPITLVQTWYLGLPNIARYCLWPILIGNQLGLNRSIFESLLAQVKTIKRKAAIQKTLEAGSAKQREGYAGRLSLGSVEGSGTAPAQEQGGITNSAQFKRASNLSMIVSENEKELSAEQYSVFDHAPGHHKELDDSLPKTRRVVSGSNDTQDGGLDAVSQGRPSCTHALAGQHLDPFSEHMLGQFYKIQRKVAKLATHWEKASVIGDLADIPVAAFQLLMNDVLCAFLLHRASINGLQSNLSDLAHGTMAQSTLYLQRLEQSAVFISGLEKILAPLVLVHLREQQSFEPQVLQRTAEQVFCCFTNLVLSSGGGSASQDQLFFLKHFISDDFSQIEWRMDFFDKLFGLAEPLLHGQFRGIDLKNEYFLHGWMMAMFGNVQGLEGIEFVLRIWDLYLLHGEAIIYCVALAILKSKLHKLNNAPMQNWQDFFHKIKKLKLPQQSLHYPIGNLAPFQSPNISQQSNQPGTGGSNSNDAEEQSNPGHALGQSDFITNHDSHLMASLIRESLSVFVAYNVPSLFKAHKMQQLVAEQKHEIFTKMYLNDDFGQ